MIAYLTVTEAQTMACIGPSNCGSRPDEAGRRFCITRGCLGWRWEQGAAIEPGWSRADGRPDRGYCGAVCLNCGTQPQ